MLVRDCMGVVRIIVDCMLSSKIRRLFRLEARSVEAKSRNLYLSINSIRSQLGTLYIQSSCITLSDTVCVWHGMRMAIDENFSWFA